VSEKVILLVEDNPDDELLAKRALQKSNISNQLLVAHDGAEALDMLFGTGPVSEPVKPALILLDLKLPKIDGLTVLKQLRAHDITRVVPVVILTSSKEEQDLVSGYAFGANSYIRKPVSFDQFVEAVRHLGIYWLMLNEPPPAPAPSA
jgi:CheY-like chemotaxis protein